MPGVMKAGCIRAVLNCRRGATSIEYALIASLISIVIVVGATMLGTNLKELFDGVASNVTTK